MCKAPKVPKPKDPKKPQFLRNKYLDAFVGDSQAVNALRSGRSSLRIDQAEPTGSTNPSGTASPVNPITGGAVITRPGPIASRKNAGGGGRGGNPRTHLR